MKKYNFAIVGVTGLVGRTFLEVLEEYKLPIDNLYVFASSRSKGNKINFDNKEIVVQELTETCFDGLNIDFALFSAAEEGKCYNEKTTNSGVVLLYRILAELKQRNVALDR